MLFYYEEEKKFTTWVVVKNDEKLKENLQKADIVYKY